MRKTYCGHASFRMEHGDVTVLVDPWLSVTGAFLGSWCQFPDTSGLDLDVLRSSDFVLISHDHQDHFDLGFLRTLSPAAVVVVPRYRHSYLVETLERELPNRVIAIEDRQPFDLGRDIRVTPVLQSVPIWDDCAFIIQSPTETILDLNDLKIPEVDLAWVARNFDIDCLLLQFSGANWHPHVYTYSRAKKRVLARRKIFTKYRHVADVVHALDPTTVIPCAGPPCFLDDELFDLNFSEHSIFPGADDFYRFALAEGFAERVRILMPGDELLTGRPGQELTEANLELPPYANKQEYLEEYRERRRPILQNHLGAIREPEGPLLERFVDHFRPLVLANPYLAERIGGGILIESTGPDREQIFVDFGDRTVPVRRYAGDPWIYRLRTERRFLNEIVEHRLRWEELLLSMRVELSRVPDVYNEPLTVFLRFADARQYEVFEAYEKTRVANDRFPLEHRGRGLMVQRTCPHAGGDLSKGQIENDCIVCPVHGWRYSLLDGSSPHPGYSISVTEVPDAQPVTA
jgi:UDP-MurNAc hydroxylase